MAGSINEDYGTDNRPTSTGGIRDEECYVPGDSLSEYRSYDPVESPSTSPPFWDSDDEEDDPGPRPKDLFGRHTWKLEKFSKEKKREMKSDPFEAGGYKWYILVYPQGCDVSNHLSLFLCVANHDKLLPGWSHFAQFTIAVGNKDPKKIKYSDTLHRFWKKEHDWGWKKFMELSKIQDGFLDDDTLEIIAQVQVIREKADRPFRCLDCPYRRELLRVYMTNIEQIYRRFMEERRNKLTKLIEDKKRWNSFCSFWGGIDRSTRHRMSREKTDTILKVVVKHFFVEKEVTSTLVMDSLYTGLKALEYRSKGNKGKGKLLDLEELPAPMIYVDSDIFVLAGDVITLLERAASEPLPCQPVSPKDDKCSQSRTKDGSSGEVNKVPIEREEKRLTELGQKILEIFVLSHIFSGIEVAYQEAVALKRQEELIREEEAAGLIENEIKGKRSGGANEKEKRAKKKQAKQKKGNRKGKDKERDDKSDTSIQERLREESPVDDNDDLPSVKSEQVTTKVDNLEEGVSDVSDNGDAAVDVYQTDLGDKRSGPNCWADAKGNGVQNVRASKKNSNTDNIFSTSSADSATGAVVNSMQSKGNILPESKSQTSPNRGKNQRNKGINGHVGIDRDRGNLASAGASDSGRNVSDCGTSPKLDQETILLSLKDKLRRLKEKLNEKEHIVSLGKKLNVKAHDDVAGSSKTKAAGSSLSSSSSVEKPPSVLKRPEQHSESTTTSTINTPARHVPVNTSTSVAASQVAPVTTTPSSPTVRVTVSAASKAELVLPKGSQSSSVPKVEKPGPLPLRPPQISSISNSDSREEKTPKVATTTPFPQAAVTAASRPASAPLVPATAPTTPTVQVSQLLSRSTSEVGRWGNDPSPSAPSYIPQSYRNAIVGKTTMGASPGTFGHDSASLGQSVPFSRSLSTYTPSTSVLLPSTSARSDQMPAGSILLPSTSARSDQMSATSVLLPSTSARSDRMPAVSMLLPSTSARSDQISARLGVTFGSSKLEALNNWKPWRDDSSCRQMSEIEAHQLSWRDEYSYPQMRDNSATRRMWKDDCYKQMSNGGIERLGTYGGLQPREVRAENYSSFTSHQTHGPVAEEFPHLDIINDLLEEEQSNGIMAETFLRDYRAFMPFPMQGNLNEAEIASVSGSARYGAAEQYYDEGFSRGYDSSATALHGLRDGQYSQLDVPSYSNGRTEHMPSKPWLYYSNPPMNSGINSNGYSHQLGDYANLTNGANGETVYGRANGHW